MQLKGCDLVAVTEAWWNSSHDWMWSWVTMYFFRKGRTTSQIGGVALYVREQLECIELCTGANEN